MHSVFKNGVAGAKPPSSASTTPAFEQSEKAGVVEAKQKKALAFFNKNFRIYRTIN